MSETGKVIPLHLADFKRHIQVMQEMLEELKRNISDTD